MKSYVDSLVHDVLVEELPDVYLSFLYFHLKQTLARQNFTQVASKYKTDRI